MTTTLINFVAENSQRKAWELDVVEHAFNGPHIGVGQSAGNANDYFDDLDGIEVGESQGEDGQRGAYDWWPLTVKGKKVGELRDDANGLTIHTLYKTKK